MVDLLKAQIQSAKLIARRATKAVQDNLDSYSSTNDSKVQALESYRATQEAANAEGATTTFNGAVEIAETLSVQGATTVQGEEIATKNFVLANAVAGDSNVEMTKTYRAEGDGTEDTFEFAFVGDSVGIYRNGFKLDSTDYTLNYDDDDKGISVTLAVVPDDGDIINMVAYGGADIYTVTQADAQFMPRQDILDNFATKIETTAVSGDTGWVDLKPYLVNDWVEYSDGYPIEYRKLGDVVYLRGLVKDGTSVKVFDGLPTSLRPTHDTYLAMPGCSDIPENSTNDWKFGIRTDGSVDYSDDNIGMTWCSIACQYLVN